ncbi:uncharacterized protein PV06_00901 [Exophiala oligosperma]|uniref:Uncharacterized protein n=1 Tax=Exophiala oligosperma TaxID=215243 RepID=A0A0D2EK66_9EURO|nr:uncharacterized protein PV06_00901 [Exophiala oligosperma]KIW48299.1 hypothetical protein PV06_00901 [Exophiala oligosperma]
MFALFCLNGGLGAANLSLSLRDAVIAAFEDAVKLVQRIRDQRETGNGGVRLPEEPTRDLIESLSLGPAIVRGHYEHDLKRFGEQYACGDIQAREGMKDILINLQMTLIITLRTVYMDNMDLDFNALQTTSDDCRVNAGVCLGQLSQRLSGAARAQAHHPASSMMTSSNTSSGLIPPLSPSLGYSSSRSTFSSTGLRDPQTPPPPPPPLSMGDQFGNLSISKTNHPSFLVERKISAGSSSDSQERCRRQQQPVRHPNPIAEQQQHPAVVAPRVDVLQVGNDDADEMEMRRRSSQALPSDDNILMLFPAPGGQPKSGGSSSPGADKDSTAKATIMHSPNTSRGSSSSHRSQNSRERYGPDDYDEHFDHGAAGRNDDRQYSNCTVYDMYNPPISPSQDRDRFSSTGSGSNSHSYASRAQASNHSTWQHVQYLQENSRPPRMQVPQTDSLDAHAHSQSGQRETIMYEYDQYQSQQYMHIPQSQASSVVSVDPPLLPRRLRPIGPGTNIVPPSGALPTVSLSARPPPTQETPQTMPSQHHHHQQPFMSSALLSPSTSHSSARSIHSSIYGDHQRSTSTSTGPSSIGLSVPSSGPLILPTDKDTLGFCKGAFRLQAGLERKAFSLANRPLGFTGTETYWRCEKCNFEGPQYTQVNVSSDNRRKGKPERKFDPRIRTSESGGIRYRWAFLARCHVQLKGMVPVGETKDGSFGSFGCIFCCAEGKHRGWIDDGHHQNSSAVGRDNSNARIKTVSVSVGGGRHHGLGIFGSGGGGGGSKDKGKDKKKSGKSKHVQPNSGVKVVVDGDDDGQGGAQSKNLTKSNNNTPIFGNVSSFMEHLDLVHRPQEGWPNAEMLGRFKVVVGRLAGVHEDGWDVNFVPFPS